MTEVLLSLEVRALEQHFGDWITEVLDCIRFRPDRKAIRQELEAHYEDHVRDLERIGYDHSLARQRALKAMGDAEEIGRALDKVHEPWLGWLWLVSKWGVVACVALLAVLFLSGHFTYRLDHLTPVQRDGNYEPEGFFYFSGDAPERTESVWIAQGSGAQTVERAGYTMSIPYAAVWKYSSVADTTGEPYDQYWITIVVAADDQRFWDYGPSGIWQDLQAKDDMGRFYDTEWKPAGGNFVPTRIYSDPFRTLQYFYINQLEPPGEWIEVSYPYGEPWSIRVNWEEVAS